MYKGITPTFTLTLPEDIDLDLATNVYVTFGRRGKKILEKTGSDLAIDDNEIGVFLSQEETLALPTGEVQIQVNWTYNEADAVVRACSDIATTWWQPNLESEVLS